MKTLKYFGAGLLGAAFAVALIAAYIHPLYAWHWRMFVYTVAP